MSNQGMNKLEKTKTLYDDFITPQLNQSKWTIAAFPLGDGNFWRWEEPSPDIKTGNGMLELTVNPYTKFHNEVQIFDNPKHLYLGTQSFPVPDNGSITFSCQMGAVTHNGDPDDFRDGFASFNVLDFQTAMVFDFIATSSKIGVIYERLLIPGITTQKEAFTEIIEVAKNEPAKLSHCQIRYSAQANQVDYLFGGKTVYSVKDLPAGPQNLSMGFGLITLRPIHMGKSTSCRGQGGTGLWSNISTSRP
jgi:hypothetical protein